MSTGYLKSSKEKKLNLNLFCSLQRFAQPSGGRGRSRGNLKFEAILGSIEKSHLKITRTEDVNQGSVLT
jgi:hypothetical protein